MQQKLAAVLVDELAGKVTVTAACAGLGISRQTYYKYRRRYLEQGLPGLAERSRRPRTSPAATPPAMVAAITAARTQLAAEGWDNGAQSIYCRLLFEGHHPPAWRTIHRVLRREGLVTDAPRKKPRSAYKRFEFPATNDCWQIDAFEQPLSTGQVMAVFEIIDDHSRYQIANLAWPREDAQGAWAVVAAGIDMYGPPQMMLSDNGLAFTGKHVGTTVLLEQHLAALGVRAVTSRPYHPQTCGKNERGHRTLRQWLTKQPRPVTPAGLQDLLEIYRPLYNNRPHQGIGGATPLQRRISGLRHPRTAAVPPPRITAVTTTVTSRGYIYASSATVWVGRPYTGLTVTAFTTGDTMRIFRHHNLIRELTLDRTRQIQPNPNGRKTPARKLHPAQPPLSAMS